MLINFKISFIHPKASILRLCLSFKVHVNLIEAVTYISQYFDFGPTVGENIIAIIKLRNNYGAIQSFIFPTFR